MITTNAHTRGEAEYALAYFKACWLHENLCSELGERNALSLVRSLDAYGTYLDDKGSNEP